MIDLINIKDYSIEKPRKWSALGTPQEIDSLPDEHKDQIFFLNEEASSLIYRFYNASKLVTGPDWDPFNGDNFKQQKQYGLTTDNTATKKWLFNCGIPFKRFVYLISGHGDEAIYLTWKMVIKYSDRIFFAHEVSIFDDSTNWCLFYFHEDVFFFGRDKIYNPEVGYKEVEELDELKRQFPKMRHPYKYD